MFRKILFKIPIIRQREEKKALREVLTLLVEIDRIKSISNLEELEMLIKIGLAARGIEIREIVYLKTPD